MIMRFIYSCLTIILLTTLTSCSLLDVKIENPAVPLSDKQMNMRLLSRDFLPQYFQTIETTMQAAVGKDSQLSHQISLTYWQLNSEQAGVKAVLQSDPMIVMLDMWLLLQQQSSYFQDEAADKEFAASKALIAKAMEGLLLQFKSLASSILSPAEYEQAQSFIQQQLDSVPLAELSFDRGSIIADWYTFQGLSIADANSNVGTLPQVMSDFSDRIGLSTQQASKNLEWKLKLLDMRSGFDNGQLQLLLSSLQQTTNNLEELTGPDSARRDEISAELAKQFTPLLEQMYQQMDQFEQGIAGEREALSAFLQLERQALAKDVAIERAAIFAETKDLSSVVIQQFSQDFKSMLVVILLALLIFILVLFFVPFYIGFTLGKSKSPKPVVA
jgi:hypothetical protein